MVELFITLGFLCGIFFVGLPVAFFAMFFVYRLYGGGLGMRDWYYENFEMGEN